MSGPSASASDIEQAKRNAAVARARVQTTVGALKQRLSPSSLAAEAKDKVRETTSAIGTKASSAVRKRPVTMSAVAGATALVLFRKPLRKLGKLLFRRGKKSDEDAKPKLEGIMRAGPPPQPSVTPRIKRAVVEANAATIANLNKE